MSNLFTIAVAGDNVVTMETSAGETTEQVSVDGSPVNGETTEAPRGGGMASGQLIMIIAMFVIMYFLLFRGPRKQQKEQAKMRSSIQKNDKILTIGGIYGTVLDVKDNEITIKIDESTNAKMKVSLNAIASKVEK